MSKKSPQLRFEGFTDDWEERKFKDNIVSIQTGTNLLGSAVNEGTPLIKMGNLQRGYFSFKKLEYLDSNSNVGSEDIVNYGDFLFNTRNTLELVGKGATWTGISGKYAFNSNIARFKFDGIDTIFFNYLYNTQQVISQVHARAVGTTSVSAVYPRDLNSLLYYLPSIEEQKKIGSFFKHLDDTIALHQRKLDLLKEQKKGYLQKMFPKNGAKVPELRFKGFTEDWKERKVSEITDSHKQGFYTKESYNENKKYYLLRGTDMTSNKLILKDTPKINASEKDYEDFKVLKDDFLIVRSGTVGTYAIVKSDITAIFGSYLINFRFNQSIVLNEFFGLFYQSSLFKSQLNKIIQKSSNVNINAENIKSTNIKFPTIEEQQKIGDYFSNLDEIISLHQRKLDLLKEQKKGFLQKMFV